MTIEKNNFKATSADLMTWFVFREGVLTLRLDNTPLNKVEESLDLLFLLRG